MVIAEIPDDGLLEGLGLLEGDESVAAADERVTAEAAVDDRLEQERSPGGAAQVQLGPERGEQVCGEHGVGHRSAGTKNDPLGSLVEQWRAVRSRWVLRTGAQAPALLVAPRPPVQGREGHRPARVGAPA
jgi:hypothetical protein